MSRKFLYVVILAALETGTSPAGETVKQTIEHEGRNRTYNVYVPDSYSPDFPTPLVLNLHGTRGTSAAQAAVSQMNVIADTDGFLVAYPQAVMSTPSGVQWNTLQLEDQVNDIEFLSGVIDQVAIDYQLDATRVYSTGFSNGGSMTYLLGHVLPDRIAAIAPMSAHIAVRDGSGRSGPIDPVASPTTNRPLPITLIHGTADYLVPIEGGTSPLTGSLYSAADDVINAWVTNNGCNPSPIVTELPNTVTGDRSTVELHKFVGCDTYNSATGEVQAEVQFYKVIGGNHQWPGGTSPPPLDNGLLQPRNDDINASQEIWNFFSRHTLPIAVKPSNEILIDDFDDSEIGGWHFLNALGNNGFGDVAASEHDGVLEIASSKPVPHGTMDVAFFSESLETDLYRNGIWRTTVEAKGEETDLAIIVRSSLSEDGTWLDGGNGLLAAVNSAGGSIAIADLPDEMPVGANPFPGLRVYDTSPQMSSHVRYQIESVTDGDVVTLKVWEEGKTEPSEPQLTWDSASTSGAAFALGIANSPPGDVVASGLFDNVTFEMLLSGDFDNDKVLDADDIDRLTAEIRDNHAFRILDLNQDGLVDSADRLHWINDIANTYMGDSNLDGEFNSGDFVQVFSANEYEDGIAGNSTWATGDWNGDAEFDSGDFVMAFSAGGYEEGPRVAVNTVPEPNSPLLVCIGLLSWPLLRRR